MNTDVDLMVAAVGFDPTDLTAQGVLYDALLEAGRTPLAARRRVNRVAREAAAAIRLVEARRRVSAATAWGSALRSRIRRAAGCGGTLAAVAVVPGNQAPTLTGEGAHTTFRTGGECRHPGAAIRRGYRLDYHPSTWMVNVGADWVATH